VLEWDQDAVRADWFDIDWKSGSWLSKRQTACSTFGGIELEPGNLGSLLRFHAAHRHGARCVVRHATTEVERWTGLRDHTRSAPDGYSSPALGSEPWRSQTPAWSPLCLALPRHVSGTSSGFCRAPRNPGFGEET